MSGLTPVGVLEYLLDNFGGYLPYPVRSLIYVTLRGLYYLPNSIANVLPLLLAAFVLYSSALSMFSTLRYAIRTAWFLAKWGLVIATIVWATGFSTGGNAGNAGRANGVGRSGYWPGQQQYGGVASQLYAAATGNNDYLRNNNLGFLYNFVPAPLRAVGDLASFFSGATQQQPASSRSIRKSTRQSTRKQQEQAEQINEMGRMAQNWLGGMAGKAWETFNDATSGRQDRWTEGRQRRENQRRNR